MRVQTRQHVEVRADRHKCDRKSQIDSSSPTVSNLFGSRQGRFRPHSAAGVSYRAPFGENRRKYWSPVSYRAERSPQLQARRCLSLLRPARRWRSHSPRRRSNSRCSAPTSRMHIGVAGAVAAAGDGIARVIGIVPGAGTAGAGTVPTTTLGAIAGGGRGATAAAGTNNAIREAAPATTAPPLHCRLPTPVQSSAVNAANLAN